MKNVVVYKYNGVPGNERTYLNCLFFLCQIKCKVFVDNNIKLTRLYAIAGSPVKIRWYSMEFEQMKIDSKVLAAIKDMKFTKATEIQEKTLPHVISGKDVIAQSMTGSGKTLVFAVPIIEKTESGKGVQALILAPTRELANQISDEFRKLSKYRKVSICEVFGGVSIEPQIHHLRTAEVVIGTPGRIMDHMQRGTINFRNLKTLVLDEADRMLDMGFIDDIRDIISQLPAKRQTMLFSATMPDEILYIARRYMNDPVKVKAQSQVAKLLLKQFYYDVKSEYKVSLIAYLIEKEKPSLAIIFCSTRTTTDIVSRHLAEMGMDAKAIHGGLTQNRRTDVLKGFHRGRPHILVATDVAARGLDIKNVSHVFNFDIPKTVDEYTNRIGRTARIGKEGKAISLLSNHDHEAFRKIFSRFDIEKLHPEGFTLKAIPLREPRQQRGGYGRGYSRGHRPSRGRRY